jgi:virginiamycin B lyase
VTHLKFWGVICTAALSGSMPASLFLESQAQTKLRGAEQAKVVPGVVVRGEARLTISEWSLPRVGATPQGLFVSAADGKVWCADSAGDALDRFDPKTEKFETYHLRPNTHPNALVAHSGSGVQSTLYFTSKDGSFIGEFDPNTRDVREFRLHGGAARLNHLIFDPNGQMWFSMEPPHPPQFPQGSKVGSVSQFTTEIRLTTQIKGAVNPFDLAVDSKGTIYFTELGKPALGMINPYSMAVKEISLSDSRAGSEGITITDDDSIWYTDEARGYLGRLDARSNQRKEWPSPSGPSSHPAQITHIGKAIWYVETGTKPNMVVRFTPGTETFRSWELPGEGVGYIYADPKGAIWFSRPITNHFGRAQLDGK